jgi:SAM-dependent methyltransferase
MRTSFESFADEWNSRVGEAGHYTHRHTILPGILKLLGNIEGKKLYDVACGNGFFSRYLKSRGAKGVWASDVSKRLIEIAGAKGTPGIKYLMRNASNFGGIPKRNFDVIVAVEAVPYIRNIDTFFRGAAQSLKSNGQFVFSCDHPLKSIASSAVGRKINPNRAALYYLNPKIESVKKRHWGSTSVKIGYERYARPLSFYINLCGKNGLYIDAIIEPKTRTIFKGKRVGTPIPSYILIRALKA